MVFAMENWRLTSLSTCDSFEIMEFKFFLDLALHGVKDYGYKILNFPITNEMKYSVEIAYPI